MTNKNKRKILELEQQIEELKSHDDCECVMISTIQRDIDERSGKEIVDAYDPDFDHEAYVKSLEFIYLKKIKLWNPYSGSREEWCRFYKCPKCGKPFCFEESITYA